MFWKSCPVAGHPHLLQLWRVQQGTPTTWQLCTAPAHLEPAPGDGLFYLWAQAEADVRDLLDEERLVHPVYRLSLVEWSQLRAGTPAPQGGLR